MSKPLSKTHSITVTAEGDKPLSRQANSTFGKQVKTGNALIEIFPDIPQQTMTGIGSSFTQSSAFVLAHLSLQKRNKLMADIYGEDGANFTLARTHIGACDFCVTGKYSYAETPDDKQLDNFSIEVDKSGFQKVDYPGIKDEAFDLLPMIKQANAIKEAQGDEAINIVASAWTAPPWMKDINDWYQSPDNDKGMPGTGGLLKAGYESVYADYLVKYLQAYAKEGVNIWAMTPVNEPEGNSGQWESMHFTAETQRDFIKDHMGPKLHQAGYSDLRVLIYDHNRNELKHWADTILSDKKAAKYIYGTAVHWYESTYKVNEDNLQWVHDKYPAFDIIHSEGCIDDLGKPAPEGIGDPDGFQEKNWFMNDAFWWNKNATDWAYTADWAPDAEDHPMYTPVHRYARNIIVSINHWLSGWIDWNIVLEAHGGPNHVGNFCGAPIMIDTEKDSIYYTPIFYILSQFSRSIRPGDIAVKTTINLASLEADELHACATVNAEGLMSVQVLNTTKRRLSFDLKIAENIATISIAANALQTIQIQLG